MTDKIPHFKRLFTRYLHSFYNDYFGELRCQLHRRLWCQSAVHNTTDIYGPNVRSGPQGGIHLALAETTVLQYG